MLKYLSYYIPISLLLYLSTMCLAILPLSAQDTTVVIESPLAVLPADTVQPLNVVPDSINAYNPNKALLFSILPGGGQWYNKQYWKTPFFAGGVAAFTTATISTRLNYNKYYKQYKQVLENYATGIDDDTDLLPIQEKKQRALQQYNLAFNALLIFYSANLIDAYMNAHINNDRIVRSPIKAAYRAMILPGWGQVYNRKYWKVPIVYAGFAVAGVGFYLNRKEYLNYKNEYLVRTRPGYYAPNNPDPKLAFISDNNILIGRKNVYRRYVEISIIGGTLWYFITVLDALIDAHLVDFDVSEDLSFRVSPYLTPPSSPYIEAGNTNASGGLSLQIGF